MAVSLTSRFPGGLKTQQATVGSRQASTLGTACIVDDKLDWSLRASYSWRELPDPGKAGPPRAAPAAPAPATPGAPPPAPVHSAPPPVPGAEVPTVVKV